MQFDSSVTTLREAQRQLASFKAGKRAEKPLYDVRYGLGNNLRRKAFTCYERVAP